MRRLLLALAALTIPAAASAELSAPEVDFLAASDDVLPVPDHDKPQAAPGRPVQWWVLQDDRPAPYALCAVDDQGLVRRYVPATVRPRTLVLAEGEQDAVPS